MIVVAHHLFCCAVAVADVYVSVTNLTVTISVNDIPRSASLGYSTE